MWWDSIDKIAANHGLPACPVCGSPLFQFESIEKWNASVDAHAKRVGDPGYPALVAFTRGKHFTKISEARAAFRAEAVQ
jgi:hypothetical protein